jgi:hypothetical protein
MGEASGMNARDYTQNISKKSDGKIALRAS